MTTTRNVPTPITRTATSGGSAPEVTPEQQVAAQANRLQMSITVTKPDGESATITGRDLVTMMARPGGLQRLTDEYGLDPQDFFKALETAIEHNQVELDLTRTDETQALYNRNDNDYVTAERPAAADSQARVQTGLEDGFRITGSAVDAPEMSFWDRVLDVLAEIFTLGFANTRLFNGAIDQDQWKNNSASIAMAGGSALRQELSGLSREESRERIKSLVQQANPDISSTEATAIAETVEAELQTIYNDPKITGTPPDESATNARLDALHRSFLAGGAEGFGGNSGEWLQANLSRTPEELLASLPQASSAAETEALLALGLPEFANLDAPSQSHLARLTFQSRETDGAGDALQNLVRNDAFRSLPTNARRKLLSAIEQSGTQPQSIDGMGSVATNIADLSANVQTRAAEALERSAGTPENLQALQSFLGSESFRNLPEALQLHALNRLDSANFSAEATTGVSTLLSTIASEGTELEVATQRALVDGVVNGRNAEERNSFVALSSSEGFKNASPAIRQASIGALQGATSQARRENLLSLLNSPGFKALPAESQTALLERFQSGSPGVQDAFAQVTPALNAMTSGEPPELAVDASVANWVVGQFTQSGGANLETKATGLAAILPSLQTSPLDPSDQLEVLGALQERRFDEANAQTLGTLANDRSFSRLDSRVRSSLLSNLGSARNDATFEMWNGLAQDNDLARLSPANQRRMVEIGNQRGASFLREARYLIGSSEFRNPGNTPMSATQRGQHQDAILSLLTRASPEASLEDLRGIRQTMRHPDFAKLSGAHQREILEHISDAPEDVALVTSMLGNYDSIPAGERQLYIDTALSVPDAAAAAHFNTIVGAGSFASATPALRSTILEGITNEGSEFSSRLAPQMGALGSTPVEQEITVYTALLEAQGESNPALKTNLARIVGDPDFQALPNGMKRDILRTLTTQPNLANSYANLVTDRNFSALPATSQQAIVAQSVNYPNTTAIGNLTRLSGASWLSSMSLADQQRSAKLIGFVSTHRHNATNPQQQRILDNTVSQFLPPTGTFTLDFTTYSDPSGTITYGSAASGVFHLNQALIPAGNAPVPNTGNARHLAMHTMAHEVNHLMNTDTVTDTHEYFMGEYGAWYVGFVAENGRPPNRQESYDRARYLLTRTSGAYDYLRQARVDTDLEYWIFGDDVPDEEAEKIIEFMGQFFNPTPSRTDANSANIIVQSGHTPPNATSPGPVPNVTRNMNNGGTAPAGGGGHDHHGPDHRN